MPCSGASLTKPAAINDGIDLITPIEQFSVVYNKGRQVDEDGTLLAYQAWVTVLSINTFPQTNLLK